MARTARRSNSAVRPAKLAEPHKIILVDQTKPASRTETEDETSTTEPDTDDLSSRRRSKGVGLSKKLTQSSVKEELARRKYAKWKRPSDDESGAEARASVASESDRRLKGSSRQSTENDTLNTLETTATTRISKDTGHEQESSLAGDANFSTVRTTTSAATASILTDRPNFKAHNSHPSNRPTSAIDLLYENQRGYFFFGIPFFSGNSLLNFDPPAWVTANGGPSPVDVQTAQVPDPSWEWEWPSWYIDMAYDVDEEGWQYSFAFFKGLSWHGTHPWFHSFVRRRRWLRKRVRRREVVRKQQEEQRQKDQESVRSAGRTNRRILSDGSTKSADASGHDAKSVIHMGKAGSKADNETMASGGLDDNKSAKRYVHPHKDDGDDDDGDFDTEIRNISILMQRLRYAAVDRERIGAVKSFLRNGSEEEIAHIAEHINHIMSLLIFDSSRRQLLKVLKREYKRISSKSSEPDQALQSSTNKLSSTNQESTTQRQSRTSVKTHENNKNDTSTSEDTDSKTRHNKNKQHTDDDDDDDDATPHLESLRQAITAGSRYIQNLEYWSDVRAKDGNMAESSLSASMSASASTFGCVSGANDEGNGYGSGNGNGNSKRKEKANESGKGIGLPLLSMGSASASASTSASASASASSSAYGTAPGGPLLNDGGTGTGTAGNGNGNGNRSRHRAVNGDGGGDGGGGEESAIIWKDVEDCEDRGHDHHHHHD